MKQRNRIFIPETPYTSSVPHAVGCYPVSFLALKTPSFLVFSVNHERCWISAKSSQDGDHGRRTEFCIGIPNKP
ncbi:hypothetical protein QN347_20500, partial [Sphingomonas sp. 10B4]|nr:hypothetical protein [Sphingomonas sp. 10B4]